MKALVRNKGFFTYLPIGTLWAARSGKSLKVRLTWHCACMTSVWPGSIRAWGPSDLDYIVHASVNLFVSVLLILSNLVRCVGPSDQKLSESHCLWHTRPVWLTEDDWEVKLWGVVFPWWSPFLWELILAPYIHSENSIYRYLWVTENKE